MSEAEMLMHVFMLWIDYYSKFLQNIENYIKFHNVMLCWHWMTLEGQTTLKNLKRPNFAFLQLRSLWNTNGKSHKKVKNLDR